MTDGAPARSGSRRRRVWLSIFVIVLLLLLVRAAVDVWAGRRIREEVARLEGRYGTIAENSLRGSRPVPAADNRARPARAAAALSVLDFGGRQELAPLRYLE